MTKKGFAKSVAWAVLAVCSIAWLLDCFALVIASGGPHYAMSGLSETEIASQAQAYHVAILLFYNLLGLFFADLFALWLLHKRGKPA